jgi:hypothetical protein
MFTNLMLADFRLTTAQQRSTGQNLQSDLCMPLYTFVHNLLNVVVQIANKMGLQKSWHVQLNSLTPIVVKVPGCVIREL